MFLKLNSHENIKKIPVSAARVLGLIQVWKASTFGDIYNRNSTIVVQSTQTITNIFCNNYSVEFYFSIRYIFAWSPVCFPIPCFMYDAPYKTNDIIFCPILPLLFNLVAQYIKYCITCSVWSCTTVYLSL